MMATEVLTSTVLDLPPSCIEFSPVEPDYFIVGTYDLRLGEPERSSLESRRSGNLVVFRYTESEL